MSENFAGGPKTAAGRARSAQNARRHGLASCVGLDPALVPEIERLAQDFAGPGADPLRQYHARRVAEAQVDLNRIRLAREEALQRPSPVRMPRPPATRKLLFVWRYLRSGGEPNAITNNIVRRLRPVELRPGEVAAARLKELNALERYERRAYSRRRSALRAMDDAAFLAERTGQACAPASWPTAPAQEGHWQPETHASASAKTTDLAERTGDASPASAAQPSAGEGPSQREAQLSAPGSAPNLAERTADARTTRSGAEGKCQPTGSAPGPASGTRPARRAPAGCRRSPPRAAGRLLNFDGPLDVPDLIRSRRERDSAQPGEDAKAAMFKSDVLEWAWRGQLPGQIARRLRLPENELRRTYAEELEFAATLIQLEISRCVHKKALSGDATAAIYILKTLHGWGKPPPPPPQPSPLSEEEKRQLVDGVMQMIERVRAAGG